MRFGIISDLRCPRPLNFHDCCWAINSPTIQCLGKFRTPYTQFLIIILQKGVDSHGRQMTSRTRMQTIGLRQFGDRLFRNKR